MNITKLLIDEYGLSLIQIMYKTGATEGTVIRWRNGAHKPDRRYREKLVRILEQQEEKKAQRAIS